MKRFIGIYLAALMILAVMPGTVRAESGSQATASRELEDLFTTIDLMDATIAGLQAEMEAGHVTAERLTQMYIDRIETYDETLKLNSVIFINPNALSDAAELDRERLEGNVRGPLHGIPIVVKANCQVAGMPVTAGSGTLLDLVAEEDAFVVKRLKEAGAVILALTNMSEFAQSSTSSRSTLGGYVHNAYDTSKVPGGSSGGTAVAVTCNFAAAGVGTDTGGSIRNPSNFGNIYGIKPTKGLTSISGVIPLKAYRDTTGPMARTAEDLALMLEIMAGSDPADDYTLEADADALLGDGFTDALTPGALKGIRIGYLEYSFRYVFADEEEYEYDSLDTKADAMLHKTFANLRKAGAEFVDLSEVLPRETIDEISNSITIDTFVYDLGRFLYEKGDAAPYKTVKELSGASFYMHMNLGWLVGGIDVPDSFGETEDPYTASFGAYRRIPEWQNVLSGRELVSRIMKENDVDAVMYAAFLDVPAKEDVINFSRYNKAGYDITFGSKLGLPDILIPMGFADTDEEYTSEMPLGLSLFADYGQDEKLLGIAYAYEQQAGSIIRRMPDITPALEDRALSAFLTDLIDRAYSIDYSQYGMKPEGKVRLMLNACEKAMDADAKDPYAVYEAARALAEAYDRVMSALEE